MGDHERTFVIRDLYKGFCFLVLFTQHWQTGSAGLPASGSLPASCRQEGRGILQCFQAGLSFLLGAKGSWSLPTWLNSGPSFSLGWPLLSHYPPTSLPVLFLLPMVLATSVPVLSPVLCHPASVHTAVLTAAAPSLLCLKDPTLGARSEWYSCTSKGQSPGDRLCWARPAVGGRNAPPPFSRTAPSRLVAMRCCLLGSGPLAV